MKASDALRCISQALENAAVPYMLTGSFASAYYGQLRSTQDIDIVIAPTAAQLKVFILLLPHDQYYADLESALTARERESMFNVLDMSTGWKIDFIICKSRDYSQEEFRRRIAANVEGVDLFVATAEDVIVSKLEWGKRAESHRHIQDARAILQARKSLLDFEYMERWIHELELTREWTEALK